MGYGAVKPIVVGGQVSPKLVTRRGTNAEKGLQTTYLGSDLLFRYYERSNELVNL